jgi:hypothetical protein
MSKGLLVMDVIPYTKKNKNDFIFPRELIMKYNIKYKCKCCNRHIKNKTINVFDSYLISICPKCGSRFFISTDNLKDKERLSKRNFSFLISAIVIFSMICVSIIIINNVS